MGLKLMSATAIFLSLACVQSANAEGGCGPGFHRDYMECADLMDPLSYRGLRLWSHRDQSSCARR